MKDVEKVSEKEIDVMVFCCQHCLENEAEWAATVRNAQDLSIKSVILPCSSGVHPVHLLKSLESGAAAIEIVACPEVVCRLLIGSRRVEKRVHYVQNLLCSIHENPERVGLTRVGCLSAQDLLALARERLKKARQIENPKHGGHEKL